MFGSLLGRKAPEPAAKANPAAVGAHSAAGAAAAATPASDRKSVV